MRITLQEEALPLSVGVHSAALHTHMHGRASHPTHVLDGSADDGQHSIRSSSRGLPWNDCPDLRTMGFASRCCTVLKGRIRLCLLYHETHPCHTLVTPLFSLEQVMRVGRTLAPGQKATKKLLRQYGAQLVCLHYRYDAERCPRFTTVELIIEQSSWSVRPSLLPITVLESR
jgi:hypothetical protein